MALVIYSLSSRTAALFPNTQKMESQDEIPKPIKPEDNEEVVVDDAVVECKSNSLLHVRHETVSLTPGLGYPVIPHRLPSQVEGEGCEIAWRQLLDTDYPYPCRVC